MLGIVSKGMENRTEAVTKPQYKSRCDCALWFWAPDAKKHVVDLSLKDGEWMDGQWFGITYLRGTAW